MERKAGPFGQVSEITRPVFRLTCMLGWLVVVVAPPFTTLESQDAPNHFAELLRSNVVRVAAVSADGNRRDGFGIIVGEAGGVLTVVTPNHVVRSDEPGTTLPNVQVTFRGAQADPQPAVLLPLNDPQLDVAVVQVRSGSAGTWRRAALGSVRRLARGTSVWSVGRARAWDVATSPGRVESVGADGVVAVEGLDVAVGSSGGALVAHHGD
jgi:hypothetical protein